MEKGTLLITKEEKAPIIPSLIVMVIVFIVTLFIGAGVLVATFFSVVIFIGFYLIDKHDYSKEFQKTLLYTQGIEITKGGGNPSEFIAYKELDKITFYFSQESESKLNGDYRKIPTYTLSFYYKEQSLTELKYRQYDQMIVELSPLFNEVLELKDVLEIDKRGDKALHEKHEIIKDCISDILCCNDNPKNHFKWE